MDHRLALDLTYLTYPLPKEFCREIAEEIKKVNLYPSGDYTCLREKFAAYVEVKKENVIPGNGLDEVIDLISRTWKGRVLIPSPTFSQFELAALREGSEMILVPCLHGERYSLEYSDEQLKEASLVWICTPNNPTGSKVSRQMITQIIEKAEGMVVVDECFYEYCGETVIDLISDYSNLIVLRSLSKSFGLAGLRLGFAVSQPENIEKLEGLRQIFNINRIAEIAGQRVFEYLDIYRGLWEKIKATRERFTRSLRQMGLKPFKSYGNFVLVGFSSPQQALWVWQKLRERGIDTLTGRNEEFSGLNSRFIRITVGTDQDMDEVLEVLPPLV